MKKIIEEVFQAEQEADGFLKEARSRAAEIRHEVDKAGADLIAHAEQKARATVQDMVEQAKKQAERARDERLREVGERKDAMLSDKGDVIDALVDDICRIVLTTEPAGVDD